MGLSGHASPIPSLLFPPHALLASHKGSCQGLPAGLHASCSKLLLQPVLCLLSFKYSKSKAQNLFPFCSETFSASPKPTKKFLAFIQHLTPTTCIQNTLHFSFFELVILKKMYLFLRLFDCLPPGQTGSVAVVPALLLLVHALCPVHGMRFVELAFPT